MALAQSSVSFGHLLTMGKPQSLASMDSFSSWDVILLMNQPASVRAAAMSICFFE